MSANNSKNKNKENILTRFRNLHSMLISVFCIQNQDVLINTDFYYIHNHQLCSNLMYK